MYRAHIRGLRVLVEVSLEDLSSEGVEVEPESAFDVSDCTFSAVVLAGGSFDPVDGSKLIQFCMSLSEEDELAGK